MVFGAASNLCAAVLYGASCGRSVTILTVSLWQDKRQVGHGLIAACGWSFDLRASLQAYSLVSDDAFRPCP
jgi:hypothetical protein